MNEQASEPGEIIIRQLSRKDSADLLDAGFYHGKSVIRQPLSSKFLQAFKLAPREINLVAYHSRQKRAVGFAKNVAHTKSLYSIKYVFVDPQFRRKGIAKQLLTYSIEFIRNKGGKKVFLTANPSNPSRRLFELLDFKIFFKSSMIRGGRLTYDLKSKSPDQLIELRLGIERNKDLLFNIYKRSMGETLLAFFETTKYNLINGYSQDHQHFFLKTAFVNDSMTAFALVFNRPLIRTASIELFSYTDSFDHSMIDGLMRILYSRGITYVGIELLNVIGSKCFDFLKRKKFNPFQGTFMVKLL